jgi:hypothetical protein
MKGLLHLEHMKTRPVYQVEERLQEETFVEGEVMLAPVVEADSALPKVVELQKHVLRKLV